MALIDGQHRRRDGQPLRLLVDHGWAVADIKSLTEANLAREVLTAAIEQIEHSLEVARTRPGANPDWYRKASMALRWKRLSLQEVERIRDSLEQQQPNECSA
jgi:hypothetical protein